MMSESQHPNKRAPELGGDRRQEEHRPKAPQLGGDAAWHHLDEGLDDSRWHVRRRALLGLTRLRDARALERLVDALDDPHKRVRETAIRLLAALENDRVIDHLLEALQGASFRARAAAAQTLGRRAEPDAAPELAAALASSDGNVRLYASSALMKLGEDAVQHIAGVLNTDRWRVRLAAVMTLEEILRGADRPLQSEARLALRAALDDPHPEVRNIAARALGEADDRAAIPALLDMLDSDDPFAREDAAVLLGELRETEAVPRLASLLDDTARGWRGQVSEAAAQALRRIGSAAAVAALERWREEQDQQTAGDET